MSETFAAFGFGAENVRPPACRTNRWVQHLAKKRKPSLPDEFVRIVNALALLENELTQIRKDRLVPDVIRELREKVVEADFGDAPEVAVRQDDTSDRPVVACAAQIAFAEFDRRPGLLNQPVHPIRFFWTTEDSHIPTRLNYAELLELRTQSLGSRLHANREVVGLAVFPDKHDLAHLPVRAVFALNEDLHAQSGVP